MQRLEVCFFFNLEEYFNPEMKYFENNCVGQVRSCIVGHICINELILLHLLQMYPRTGVVGGRFTVTRGAVSSAVRSAVQSGR